MALQKILSSGFLTSSIRTLIRVNTKRFNVCPVHFRLHRVNNNNRKVAFNSVETSFLATKDTGSWGPLRKRNTMLWLLRHRNTSLVAELSICQFYKLIIAFTMILCIYMYIKKQETRKNPQCFDIKQGHYRLNYTFHLNSRLSAYI